MSDLDCLLQNTLNPLRENTNREIVEKINELINAVRELQNLELRR